MSDINKKTIKVLNDLIGLDYDAIQACDATLARLESSEYKASMTKFRECHERHAQDLSQFVAGLGGEHAHGPDIKQYISTGKVMIADLVGGDHALLWAMHSNEDVTTKAYESALETEGLNPQLRSLLENNRADARRNRDWISAQLDHGSAD